MINQKIVKDLSIKDEILNKKHVTNLKWKDSTLALHAGEETKYGDSHSTPIFATSTFLSSVSHVK